jgi:hypothetical protein
MKKSYLLMDKDGDLWDGNEGLLDCRLMTEAQAKKLARYMIAQESRLPALMGDGRPYRLVKLEVVR